MASWKGPGGDPEREATGPKRLPPAGTQLPSLAQAQCCRTPAGAGPFRIRGPVYRQGPRTDAVSLLRSKGGWKALF